jgi:hypothetical protein
MKILKELSKLELGIMFFSLFPSFIIFHLINITGQTLYLFEFCVFRPLNNLCHYFTN